MKRLRKIVAISIVVCPLIFMFFRWGSRPLAPAGSVYENFSTAKTGLVYRIISDTIPPHDHDVYAFVLYEPVGDSMVTLIVPLRACDTIFSMEARTLRIDMIELPTLTRTRILFRTRLNPYRNNFVTPMPYVRPDRKVSRDSLGLVS